MHHQSSLILAKDKDARLESRCASMLEFLRLMWMPLCPAYVARASTPLSVIFWLSYIFKYCRCSSDVTRYKIPSWVRWGIPVRLICRTWGQCLAKDLRERSVKWWQPDKFKVSKWGSFWNMKMRLSDTCIHEKNTRGSIIIIMREIIIEIIPESHHR